MKNLNLLAIGIIITGLYSCNKDEAIVPEVNNISGIVITFDDHNIYEWVEADSRLKSYNWKASFCINSYSKLSNDEKQKLHDLADGGHEISGHGYAHKDAVEYIDSLGMQDYLDKEIYPMLNLMEQDGFTVKTFAYPYGSRNEQTDTELLKVFDVVRGIGRSGTYKSKLPDCCFNGSPVVYGYCIEGLTTHFKGLDYNKCLTEALTYAKENNKILVCYAHHTVENVTDSYEISFSALELICKFIKDNDMKFYTLSDLKGMVNK